MELRYKREAAVGLFMLAGAAIFVLMLMWLQGRDFRPGEQVRATFADVAGLKVGDPVRTSGVAVGTVRAIRLVGPGNVVVTLDVHTGPAPRSDATAEIRAADLFGARFVEYRPGASDTALASDAVLRGTRVEDMGDLAVGLAGQARELLAGSGDIVRELRLTLVETRRLVATMERGASGGAGRLQDALEELRMALHRVNLMMAETQPAVTQSAQSARDASRNLERITANLATTTAALDSMVSRVNSGRGALGQLVNDTTLINELRATNTALRELLVDIKAEPGRYIRLRF